MLHVCSDEDRQHGKDSLTLMGESLCRVDAGGLANFAISIASSVLQTNAAV